MKKFTIFFLSLTLIMSSCKNETKNSKNEKAMDKVHLNTTYIGTYTKKEGHVDGQAAGIYTVYQNPEDGSLKMGETVAKITNPSFVKVSKDGRNLYAVSELGPKDASSGFVFFYKINEDNSLTEIGKISTEGFAPCHIAIDTSGDYVFVSNYTGGVVMVYKKKPDGNLEKHQRLDIGNPEESNTHSVTISPDNQHIYIADLGLSKIWIFDFNASKGALNPNEQAFVSLEEGSGPRHLTISKNQDFLYSANELNSSVSTFKILDNGGLELIQNLSTLPENYSENNSVADIHIHPSGEFLYISNRGHNSIASFKINRESGKLIFSAHTSTQGKTPRNFAIGPEGNYLYAANQDSNSIAILKIDEETGKLDPILEPFEIKTPVCIEF